MDELSRASSLEWWWWFWWCCCGGDDDEDDDGGGAPTRERALVVVGSRGDLSFDADDVERLIRLLYAPEGGNHSARLAPVRARSEVVIADTGGHEGTANRNFSCNTLWLLA